LCKWRVLFLRGALQLGWGGSPHPRNSPPQPQPYPAEMPGKPGPQITGRRVPQTPPHSPGPSTAQHPADATRPPRGGLEPTPTKNRTMTEKNWGGVKRKKDPERKLKRGGGKKKKQLKGGGALQAQARLGGRQSTNGKSKEAPCQRGLGYGGGLLQTTVGQPCW